MVPILVLQYEIDFLDANFAGCADCFSDVHAADKWYKVPIISLYATCPTLPYATSPQGMNDAAQERNVTIQYCLPSATDMLASLSLPAVVQARASGDYARPEGNSQPWGNVVTLGGSSLLMGATKMAPSKDTLWTASPQPPTASDRTHSNTSTQPHVDLDSILATLSLGPVGISDCLNYTDAALIRQAFMSKTDSTLLRPSRPLSTVDSVFTNKSLADSERASLYTCDEEFGSCEADGAGGQDIRSTHAALPGGGPNTHYVLAWMTTEDVTLQPTDLYPKPKAGVKLALREHYARPGPGCPGGSCGCEDGKPASHCVQMYAAGEMPSVPAAGGNISKFIYVSIYETAKNGAYFLGELLCTSSYLIFVWLLRGHH